MSFFMKSPFLRKVTFPLQLRHLKNSMKGGDVEWYNAVDDVVILGAIPLKKKSKWISELNLGGVVSLNEPFESKKTFSVEEWSALGITNLKFNIADHVGAASLAEVHQMIRFILEQGALGKEVYVHCKAGKGRSASVVMCYLCQIHNISPDEAFTMLQEKRPQISLGPKQWRLVRSFCNEQSKTKKED